jgi:putative FmdB family regulatory protein
MLESANVKEEIMPIYEYRCEKCGQTNEFLILKRGEAVRCKQCGSEDLTRLLSAHNMSTSSSRKLTEPGSGSCCGTPNSCGTPGSCCSG